ncbi:MAG: isoprenylcysteine carboxylmethyltransferase family protein [Verrucomicrobia bacterium]|nr:isoprenylcysteine carboxylmethyltransferase family protein [Verrucomicrobiota bacterium]
MNLSKGTIPALLATCIQLAAIAALAMTGPVFAPSPTAILAVISVAIGLWAVWSMSSIRWHIAPIPPAAGNIVVRGPYRWIRHPMYAAVIGLTLSWIISQPTQVRVATWVILLVVLGVKIRLEERMLLSSFPDYPGYKERTKAIIPFVI